MAIICKTSPKHGVFFDEILSIQAHDGQVTHYNPLKFKDPLLNYFSLAGGLPRRVTNIVYEKKPYLRFALPKTGPSAPRTEAVSKYDRNHKEYWFSLTFLIPGKGADKWCSDENSYTVICQWHEHKQPFGGRRPPFEIFLRDSDGGLKLHMAISHDHGNGSSGKEKPADTIFFELSNIEFDKEYKIIINAKAAGVKDDFVKCWINNKKEISYSGYCGYPNGEQNFFKFGVYCYSGVTGAENRVVYFSEFLQGDEFENYNSIVNYDFSSLVKINNSCQMFLGFLKDLNFLELDMMDVCARGGGGNNNKNGFLNIFKGVDSNILFLNIGVDDLNFDFHISGICKEWSKNGFYNLGDVLIPRERKGVSIYSEFGMKYICVKAGFSGNDEPLWAEKEYQLLIDGGVYWRAEKREACDVVGYRYSNGDIAFDPNSFISGIIKFCLQENVKSLSILSSNPKNIKESLSSLIELGIDVKF